MLESMATGRKVEAPLPLLEKYREVLAPYARPAPGEPLGLFPGGA